MAKEIKAKKKAPAKAVKKAPAKKVKPATAYNRFFVETNAKGEIKKISPLR